MESLRRQAELDDLTAEEEGRAPTPSRREEGAARRSPRREAAWDEEAAFSALLAGLMHAVHRGRVLSHEDMVLLRAARHCAVVHGGGLLTRAETEELRAAEGAWRPRAREAMRARFSRGGSAESALQRDLYDAARR